MKWSLAILLLASCGDDLPSTADLRGAWTTGDVGNETWDVTFAAEDDGTHAELDGLADVYLWSAYATSVGGGFVQTGTYRVDGASLIRVLAVDDGPWPAGTELINAIETWDEDRFVLELSDSVREFRRE